MATKPLPPISALRQLLAYNAATGALKWIAGTRRGREAFTSLNSEGYRVGMIRQRIYRAHRVAWALHHGCDAPGQIDHIDGNRANNRIANLRVVTNAGNQRNVALTRNNTSGVCGVTFIPTSGKWRAKIMVDCKMVHLGYFASIEEAARARADAERKYGFAAGHGRPRDT